MKTIEIRRLGLLSYADGLSLQRTLVDTRQRDLVGDLLLLVEHPHVPVSYTHLTLPTTPYV